MKKRMEQLHSRGDLFSNWPVNNPGLMPAFDITQERITGGVYNVLKSIVGSVDTKDLPKALRKAGTSRWTLSPTARRICCSALGRDGTE